MLTSRFIAVAESTTSDIRGFLLGGDRLTHFVSNGTNHARKESGRSRDSPVILLHCSIRTRGVRTVLATRPRPTRVTGAGLAGTHCSRDSLANPCLAWIHGSVPQMQPRPCGRSLIGSGITPCAGEGRLKYAVPRFPVRPRGACLVRSLIRGNFASNYECWNIFRHLQGLSPNWPPVTDISGDLKIAWPHIDRWCG